MGMLEIRRSSAQVKPLGDFKMPELRTGAAEAWSAHARAAQSAASAAREAGMAAVRGISERGQIVADAFGSVGETVGKLGKLAQEIIVRENRREAQTAINEMELWRTLEMNGDGTEEHPGRFHETIEDARTWLDSVSHDTGEKLSSVRERLSPGAQRFFDEVYSRDDLLWQKRIAEHASKVTLQNEVAASDGMVALRLKQASVVFGDPSERDEAINKYFAEVESNLDTKFVPAESRAALRRQAAFNLVSSAEKATIEKWQADTADCSDPAAVASDWDEAIAKAKATDGKSLLDNAALKSAIGDDGLTEREQTLLLSRLEDGKAKAVSRASQLQTQYVKSLGENEAQGLSAIALPDETDERDLARYHSQRSQFYHSIVTGPEADRIAKSAPAKFKAYQNMAVNEANSAISHQRKANGSKFLALIDDGFVGDHEITAAEIQATADQLMAEKLITQADYDKAKRAKAKSLSPAAKALHEKIFAQKGAKFPEMMKWQENIGRFNLPESKAATKAASTHLSIVKEEHWYGDDKETILFKDYVKAANYAIQYLETKNCTVDQAFAEFQALTLNTEKELAALAYEERLKRKEEALAALRKRTTNRNSSFAKEVVK